MFSINLIIVVVLLALLFDYVNGFHDTTNAIASAVATKALQPGAAILMAAILNFMGAVSGTAVAAVIGQSIINPHFIEPQALIAALGGAIIWNLITWYLGLPSSSSHSLIGGMAGGVLVSAGPGFINWYGLLLIIAVLLITPFISFLAGGLIMKLLLLLLTNTSPTVTNDNLRKFQVLSSAMASFAHGSNDAQKSMGIITMALISGGMLGDFFVPLWVKISCAATMAAGTAMGGWRIIRTIGQQIFHIKPANGFAADLSAAIIIYSASLSGFPVSTTHVVSSAIIGAGAAKRMRGVRWITAVNILIAWLITIPAAGITAMIIYLVIQSGLL